MSILLDGQPAEAVPADDRGLLYGESAFETIAFQDGRAPLWDRHIARLGRAAAAIGWDMPDSALLAAECTQALRFFGADRAVVRITLTGGSGGQGYWPPAGAEPRRIIWPRRWPVGINRQRQAGLATIISRYRLGPPGPLSGLKHGNRLLQTLVARECRERGGEEALLLDEHGQLAEAISSNLILVAGRRLLSPARVAVAGVALAWLSEELGGELESGSVPASQLELLSEVLVINSVAGIRPVIAVDQHRFGCGPVGRRLQALWHKELFRCA
ncbi:MAG: aminotransferase class IV [Wenzhouxiangella sp.]